MSAQEDAREELATMRAAAERCKELAAVVVLAVSEDGRPPTEGDEGERGTLCFSAQAIANAIDAARELCSDDAAARDEISVARFIEGLLRAYAIARLCERATPTEGDLPIEPTDTPKGGA